MTLSHESKTKKLYWTKEDKEQWEQSDKIPTWKLLEYVLEMAKENCDVEGSCIIERFKQRNGMKYKIVEAYPKKYLLEFGVPANELLEVEE